MTGSAPSSGDPEVSVGSGHARPKPDAPAMVQAVGLTKRYGDHTVLSGVNLSIHAGERVAVLGLNGTGKTTLFRCLLGLIPFEGDLAVAGHCAGPDGTEARRRIGYLPQQPPRFDLRLGEFLDIFTALRGTSPEGPGEWLTELGLPLSKHGNKSLRQLSGGMLQKALLALALGSGSPVLLLDEPTANLDAASRREFLRAIGRAVDTTTLLFASHRLDDVESLATRLLVLHDARFVFDGSATELMKRAGVEARVDSRPRAPALEDIMQSLVSQQDAPK